MQTVTAVGLDIAKSVFRVMCRPGGDPPAVEASPTHLRH